MARRGKACPAVALHRTPPWRSSMGSLSCRLRGDAGERNTVAEPPDSPPYDPEADRVFESGNQMGMIPMARKDQYDFFGIEDGLHGH